ncbi:hypothetical protein D3C80_1754470 [compost metagenome]
MVVYRAQNFRKAHTGFEIQVDHSIEISQTGIVIKQSVFTTVNANSDIDQIEHTASDQNFSLVPPEHFQLKGGHGFKHFIKKHAAVIGYKPLAANGMPAK